MPVNAQRARLLRRLRAEAYLLTEIAAVPGDDIDDDILHIENL